MSVTFALPPTFAEIFGPMDSTHLFLTHWHPMYPHVHGNKSPLKFQCAHMHPVKNGFFQLAVAWKQNFPGYWGAVKCDSLFYSLYDFSQIFQQNVLVSDMASGRIDESKVSSDEEQEVFAGFTIEEIGDIRQAHQTWQEQNLLRNLDGEIKDFFNLQRHYKGKRFWCWATRYRWRRRRRK